MKRILPSLLLASLIVLASCDKETLLTIDQSALSFTNAGGSQNVSLVANKPWTASPDQSWCKVSPSGGEEATIGVLSITCEANPSYDDRTCTVTFTCEELTKTLSVSQSANNGLQVSQTSYELNNFEHQLNIQVQANVKFSVEVDNGCKEWVKYVTTKGLSPSTVVLDILENTTYDNREGKVTIKQEGGNLSSTITIKQSQMDGLFVTTPEYSLSNEHHTLTVEVNTNIDFDVKSEADWIRYVETKGLSAKQIVLDVAENDTYDQREGKVTVKPKNGSMSSTITIKQSEAYGILASTSWYNVGHEATTIDVEVHHNVDLEVVIPDDCKGWIKHVKTKGLPANTYSFSIAANETYDNRYGSITFKQKNGEISATVTIYQSQTNYLKAEQTEYQLTMDEQDVVVKVQSNVSFEVVIDDACKDWLSRVGTKGMLDNVLYFHINKNEGKPRQGTVVLKGETIQETITIHQGAEDFVAFEDPNFKAYCVENFDENKNGEISIGEARSVTGIQCSGKSIRSLSGIEQFVNVNDLDCSSNLLTSLDVRHNTKLTRLDCSSNQLTSLDVSQNDALTSLHCQDNPGLKDIWLQVGQSIPDLQYDTASADIRRKNDSGIELVVFEDANFKAFCVGQFDKDHDGEVSVDEVKYVYRIEVNTDNIVSLGGIEYFTQLEELRCNGSLVDGVAKGRLAKLNINENKRLRLLECMNNQLTSFDLSQTHASSINLNNNQITRFELSKDNTSLKTLQCSNNQLSSLDLYNYIVMEYLVCSNNKLTSLRIGYHIVALDCSYNKLMNLFDKDQPIGLSSLQYLYCNSNQLMKLKLDTCTKLTILDCSFNKLSSLDVIHNTALKELLCSSNQLSALHLINNIALQTLICDTNKLTSLDVSFNPSLNFLVCINNPNLTEIWLRTGQTIETFTYDKDVATVKYKAAN